MKHDHEYKYDENTVFYGEIEVTENSLGDESAVKGVSSFYQHEVRDFAIIVYIKGFDHDVTLAIKVNDPELFDLYQDEFLDHFLSANGYT